MVIEKIKLADIPVDPIYQGYLWMSDKKEPEVFFNQLLDPISDQISNPFIIEGYLFDRINSLSFSIRYLDGAYYVNKYHLENDTNYSEMSFLTNRIADHPTIFFRQYWEAVVDEYCEGMEVLKPKANVFVGFSKTEE